MNGCEGCVWAAELQEDVSVVVLVHRLFWHVRPEPHCGAVVQHAWPEVPHAVVLAVTTIVPDMPIPPAAPWKVQ